MENEFRLTLILNLTTLQKYRFRYKDSNTTTWENDPKGVEN